MSRNNFETLLEMVRPTIEKSDTRFREAIPAEVRLAITLRFLATGDSFASLMYLFRVSKQSISALVPEVLKAIIESLHHFIKMPENQQQWKQISQEIFVQWNYPNCIGALDGKHILILRPENTVGEFHNYKGTHSIVLMAIVDAKYNFVYVNIGCQGRISDGGVFKHTDFAKRLENGTLNLPCDEPLPGHDAFPLSRHIMKPFAINLIKGSPRRVHNYRLSRARRLVENAFGLLSSVFRIFRKPIEVKVDNTVSDIVLACVYLHNFLRSQNDSQRFYAPPGSFDTEDSCTGQIIPGSWRQITASDTGVRQLRKTPRNASNAAKAIREEFMEFFISPQGSITQQKNI
nr:unnamed protein product [Callosobruchus chinensis]